MRATVADPGFRYFPDTQVYRPIIPPVLSVINGSALHQQSTSPSDTDTVSLPQKMHHLTLLSRHQNFCFSTSCSIYLLVQTQVSHQFLQPLIFILHLPQTPQFRYARTGEFLLKKRLQKCPSFGRIPRHRCRFRPVSAQTQSVLRYSGSFSWRCSFL